VSHTGLEKVDSYAREQAALARAILGDVPALHSSHVGLQQVLLAVAAGGGAGQVGEGGE